MRTDDDALSTELMHTGVWSAGVEDALRLGAERGIPMICANPDFHVTLPDGTRGHMPGILARRYEELGGHVVYFGKPHRAAFEAALRLLNVPPSRVLHVGDSLLHGESNPHSTYVTHPSHPPVFLYLSGFFLFISPSSRINPHSPYVTPCPPPVFLNIRGFFFLLKMWRELAMLGSTRSLSPAGSMQTSLGLSRVTPPRTPPYPLFNPP